MSRDTLITLEVTPAGLPFHLVLAIMAVPRCRVRRWLGRDLGTPRDYTWPKGAEELWFTPPGIRNLAELVGQEVVVIVQKKKKEGAA